MATRVAAETLQPRDRLEVRATVRLARDEQRAAEQAHRLAEGIDRAIRGVLGLPGGPGLLQQLARQEVRR